MSKLAILKDQDPTLREGQSSEGEPLSLFNKPESLPSVPLFRSSIIGKSSTLYSSSTSQEDSGLDIGSDVVKQSPIQNQAKLSELTETLPYNPPEWSGLPRKNYYFELIKNGCSLGNLELNRGKEFLLLGRIPLCHIILDHPSVSRFHAALQFSAEEQAYLIDLKSVHGTFVNKTKLVPYEPFLLKDGYIAKFADSTRMYVFHIPDHESDEETSPQILQENFHEEEEDTQNLFEEEQSRISIRNKAQNTNEQEQGINWGIKDYDEEIYQQERSEERCVSTAKTQAGSVEKKQGKRIAFHKKFSFGKRNKDRRQ